MGERSLELYGRLGFVEPATFGDLPSFGMLNRDGFDPMLGSGTPQPPAEAWAMHQRREEDRD